MATFGVWTCLAVATELAASGELLAMQTASGNMEIPIYDANGDVQGLTDRNSGQITANYEYSQFGEILRSTGTYSTLNPFLYSSRYTDLESHLIYYGYRYLSPSLGRWLGRDPLGESGSLHLYSFCRNNAVNLFDRLARSHLSKPILSLRHTAGTPMPIS